MREPSFDLESPQPLVQLNSADTDDDPWLAPDLSEIYFVRKDNNQSGRIYHAIVGPPGS